MHGKIKTWTLRFPAKENPNMEKALFDWPIVLQYDVKPKYRLISRKFSGVNSFHPSVRLTNQKPRTFCIRSTNQSNRSISVRLLLLCCSRVFISRSYENRSILLLCNRSEHVSWGAWLDRLGLGVAHVNVLNPPSIVLGFLVHVTFATMRSFVIIHSPWEHLFVLLSPSKRAWELQHNNYIEYVVSTSGKGIKDKRWLPWCNHYNTRNNFAKS